MIPDTSAQDRPLSAARPERPAWRRWLWPAVAAVPVLALLAWVVAGWGAGSRSYDASRIRIAEVTRGDLVRDISADGRVITANSPTLYAIAGGTVSLKVVAGDAVKQGQVLAVIDSPELRSKLVQEESTLASMEAEASRAQLDAQIAQLNARRALDQAEIDHTAAQRDLERYERGHAGGAVSNIELASARDELKKADIGLQTARRDAGLQGQGAALDARNKRLLADRQKAVAAELQRQVEALTLRAPFDGQVGQVQISQGTNVAINAPILSVVDLSEFEVEIRVPESFARDLGIGVPAQVTSQGRPFPAKVSAVSPEVVNGEVTARLRFDEGQQPPGLRQNQRLSARIVLDTRKDVLMVERGPFVEQEGGRFAWVVEGRSAVRRPVQTGVSSLGYVEIVSGAKEGDRIVVSGSDQFGDAERVAVN
ncbi:MULTISPECIES: efflux RND transporter periplasmic adaptor subunit [Pseudoxanthomonas]|uniref:Efflux RND transporter periplasmic adaptor subunit n=1 Tax=Pseudoxanthomonas kaohsiungensis TaxID=283923 RepID=A0ABW3LRU8_9GAMM|nr:efflux RND transporter periplasmic adaptor subunit [Pseudoxanthomonas kaohsiungensis]KAF1704208.1 efflux transporter periplasmic adaptor subunit [Pseudoxanthomonas kaohsiungensis]